MYRCYNKVHYGCKSSSSVNHFTQNQKTIDMKRMIDNVVPKRIFRNLAQVADDLYQVLDSKLVLWLDL